MPVAILTTRESITTPELFCKKIVLFAVELAFTVTVFIFIGTNTLNNKPCLDAVV